MDSAWVLSRCPLAGLSESRALQRAEVLKKSGLEQFQFFLRNLQVGTTLPKAGAEPSAERLLLQGPAGDRSVNRGHEADRLLKGCDNLRVPVATTNAFSVVGLLPVPRMLRSAPGALRQLGQGKAPRWW